MSDQKDRYQYLNLKYCNYSIMEKNGTIFHNYLVK